MAILVTGGAGYIGSHTVVKLLENEKEVVIIDNLVNSNKNVIKAIEKITNKKPHFYEANISDEKIYEKIFKEHKIEACIHFAGLKAVGESVESPLLYYKENVAASITLFLALLKNKVDKIIFSSSATVYGNPKEVPIKEEAKVGEITNPYGRTKYMLENILIDMAKAYKTKVSILRYFNPIGASKTGLIGENPNGIPNNLMPYITQVAVGKREKLTIFGNDYNTKDGTGVRDYIHVEDLAKGHIKALEKLEKTKENEESVQIYNLGTGKGSSVLEVVKTFEKVNGVKINYEMAGRRSGDVESLYCDTTKAKEELGFVATKTLEEMCVDAFNYQKNVGGKNG